MGYGVKCKGPSRLTVASQKIGKGFTNLGVRFYL